ncbi:MAG: hypothetical protein KGL11_10445 [Alphaproteobacteria bacterium]|nr:hypothetical protein [Alphaproteobacteria bacterium]
MTKRIRKPLPSDERQRRLAERYEQLSDSTASHLDNVDVMSADSFPASDPPSFTASRSGRPR